MSGCRHPDRITLRDGTRVRGAALLVPDPYARTATPTFGLYFDEAWAPPWPHRHFPWPDFGVPDDIEGLRDALTDLLNRARKGEDVELGCLGGHGRTGTALACAVVLTGLPAEDAVAWVRENHCEHAVEGAKQEGFVLSFGDAALSSG